ncbi:alpha/beta hydrolase [Cellulomonas sp. KRMCY2]|uniref:alpha/beta hydrolase n=1 Tax=Cellulomonas sp. KRMCY2 TaxID=1304865 RepID=UPI0004B6C83D|nr:alpha/beta hydrolase [Cellulomonas sp. KRMCY2]
MTSWVPDPLGPGWEQTTIDLGVDAEGPLVATLVRAARGSTPGGPADDGGTGHGGAVLYVHGFNDYFFQTHLADQWLAHGYTFYALDLRRCGRSLRAWQTPHFCTDLTEYVGELSAAARLIRGPLGHDRLVVMAHSTGGLTASLWAHSLRNARVVDALVLNSPWFDLNARWFQRVIGTRVLDAVGPLDPQRIVAEGHSAYSHHLHVANGGRWDYDLRLKPPEGFPVRAGWLRAVRRGQARLVQGLQISAPVLVCTAQTSGANSMGNPGLDSQDTILDVEQIAARVPLLGADVTLVRIADGIHDLSLSAEGPRAEFFATVFGWLDDRLTVHDGDPVGSRPA